MEPPTCTQSSSAASGKVIARTADRARAVEFLEFLDLIDAQDP